MNANSYNYPCDECPYEKEEDGCKSMMEDALALIQRLEADNAKKDETIQMLQDGNASLMDMIDEECEKTARLERERDAAVSDIKKSCETCRYFEVTHGEFDCNYQGACDNIYSAWEWRGVPEPPKEET